MKKKSTTRKRNAGQGMYMTFHGSFIDKAKAMEKEAATPGSFIRPTTVRGKRRWTVMSQSKENPFKAKKKASKTKVRATKKLKVNPKRKRNALFSMPHLFKRKTHERIAEQREAKKSRRSKKARKPKAKASSSQRPLMIPREVRQMQGKYYLWDKKGTYVIAGPFDTAEQAARAKRNPKYRNARRRRNTASMKAKAKSLLRQAKAWMRSQGKRKSNPEEKYSDQRQKADELYRKFHGKEPDEVIEILEAENLDPDVVSEIAGFVPPEDYAKLGDLHYLKFAPEGSDEGSEIRFGKGERPILAADPSNQTLHIIGGNQDVTELLPALTRDNSKDMVDLGECYEIEYYTQKAFDKFVLARYYHEFGEENGIRPRLMFDRKLRKLCLIGGDYKIRREGIVN